MNRLPLISLVLANMSPLIGVLFFDWDLFSIFFLYWLETAIIGLYAIPKIIKTSSTNKHKGLIVPQEVYDQAPDDVKNIASYKLFGIIGIRIATKRDIANTPNLELNPLFLIPFFCLHFGIFMFVHLLILITLFGPFTFAPSFFFISGISLLISHGISYRYNFLGKKEYETTTNQEQSTAIYKRVGLMHFILIIGGIVVEESNIPTAALIIMVLLKTVLDLNAHYQEHHRNSSNQSS